MKTRQTDSRARSVGAAWLGGALLLTHCGAPVIRPDGALPMDAGRADASGPCPPGGTLCGEVCVDTVTDRTNCGACGVTCAFAVACVDGRCDDGNCPAGRVRCGAACVDPRASAEHCGGCGNPCDRGVACVDGACASGVCLPGFVRCGRDCAELSADARHCGACGAACAAGQGCVEGRCVASMCREGLVQCGASCTDLRFDPRHCGACGRACASTQRCSLGMCEEVPCTGMGMTRCRQSCVNILTDPSNCGVCDVRCPSGMCSGGRCVENTLRPRWAVSFGTVGEDAVRGVAVDPAGNVYVAGSFDGPMTLGGRVALTTRGRTDAFVASYTSAGALRWARSFGGRGMDEANAIAVGTNGRVYVAGYFSGEFVTETGGTVAGPGQLDGFALALDAATGAERAVRVVGGLGFEVLSAVSFRAGRLVFGGRFSDTLAMESERLTSAGRDDALVFTADPNTLRPIWSRAFGGVNDDRVNAVLLDDAGRVFFGGNHEASVTWGRSTVVSRGSSDGFVAAMDATGAPQWAERFGGEQADSVQGLETDGAGGLVGVGFFRGTAQYPLGMTIAARGSDVIMFPVSIAGVPAMPRTWGSVADDLGYGVARGSDGRWLLAGSVHNGANFGLGDIETYFLTADAFVAGFDRAWTARSVPTVQGARDDAGYAVAIGPDNSAVWGGTFTLGGNLGLGFVPGAGGTDGFIVYVGP
jgi:hypothetical protein